MHSSPMEILADGSASIAARVMAAAELRRLLETGGDGSLAAWQAVCGVAFDERAPAEVRRAAVRAIAGSPGAAQIQLVRAFTGDNDRSVRKEAIAVLRTLGVAPTRATRLEERLAVACGPDRANGLFDLARFGHDPRIVAALDDALRDPDEDVRGLAIPELAMLGEMARVVAAVDDPAPAVRACAVENLGLYFTGDDAEARALDRALGDPDATVRKAATVALRRVGRRPLAAIASRRVPAPPGDDPFGWRPILEELSLRALANRNYAVTLDDEIVEGGWLGHPGATPAAIATLEKRLGAKLPPSYAAFLRVSDGFRILAPALSELLPAARVRRFVDENADWLVDSSIPPDAVQITEILNDDAVILLVPTAGALDGEWEAWILSNATWLLHTERFRSFLDLVRAFTYGRSRSRGAVVRVML